MCFVRRRSSFPSTAGFGARWKVAPRELIRGALRRGPRSGRGAHRCLSLDHPKDVALFHDEQILTINLDFGARPLPEEDAVTTLDVERHDPAALITATRSRGDHLALHRLLLRSVGNDDAARCLRVFFNPAHDHTIMQRTELHGLYLTFCPRFHFER